jgi:hypothetical protein
MHFGGCNTDFGQANEIWKEIMTRNIFLSGATVWDGPFDRQALGTMGNLVTITTSRHALSFSLFLFTSIYYLLIIRRWMSPFVLLLSHRPSSFEQTPLASFSLLWDGFPFSFFTIFSAKLFS